MTPTMTLRPTHVASFDKMAKLHSTAEDVMDERHPRHPARPSTAGAASTPSAYPMYPGLQTSSTDRIRCKDGAVPFVLNRPRKLSGNNNNNNTTPFGHIPSPDGRLHGHISGYRPRSSSYGNGAPRYDDLDAYSYPWRRPNYGPPSTTTAAAPALRKMKSRAKLGDMISTLPGEVLDVILEMLKDLHLGRGGESCATCWMRDVCSVSLCSRKWSKPARLALYHDIQLIGPDSAAHKKKFKMAQGSRMMLLRRTLRTNDEIATLVRSLRVPAAEGPFHGKGAAAALEQYENNVAALVMACPNLERLSGPDLAYDHSFRRLFHALSTRTNLKDMDWLIDPSGSLSGGGGGSSSSSSSSSASSSKECVVSDHGALQAHEESAFLDLHRGWSRLTSLSLQCRAEATLAPPTLLARTLTMLPSLQHLHLHNVPAAAFNDTNLLSLPPLQSLTLSNLGGITSNGLSAFATLPSSQPLRRLVLRHVPLTSLPALARILSNLGALGDLSLVQSFPPLMPASDAFILWMMPYLASSSLRRLHWDITSHPDSANAADSILAQSIRAGGFPGLETLRAPNDPEGIFQQLCRPVERLDLPSDRYLARRHQHHHSGSTSTSTSLPASPVAKRQLAKSPTSSSLPGLVPLPVPHTNLALARLAAQARLEQAREKPLFRVDVTDEQGRLVDSFGLAGYVGTLGSPINYHLLPDRGSADDRGGLVDVSDLRAERAPGATDGCTGRWNWREDADKKDKDKERSWWHTERGPWRRVSLAGRVA